MYQQIKPRISSDGGGFLLYTYRWICMIYVHHQFTCSHKQMPCLSVVKSNFLKQIIKLRLFDELLSQWKMDSSEENQGHAS